MALFEDVMPSVSLYSKDYSLFAHAAVPAMRAILLLSRKKLDALLNSGCVINRSTGEPIRETLEDDYVDAVASYEKAIADLEDAIALCGPEAAAVVALDKQQYLTSRKTPSPSESGLFSDDPREYGVTVTADVSADSPQESTEAFIEELGIQNPEGLTFHVEHLHTGQKWEF
jgi:hypothetical protein